MTTAETFQQLLDEKGIPLPELGIRDIALSREDALLAVAFLKKESVPILGGDVYLKRGNKMEADVSSWHSDPKPGENRAEYLARSWATTEEYLRNFPQQPTGIVPFFSMVVGD